MIIDIWTSTDSVTQIIMGTTVVLLLYFAFKELREVNNSKNLLTELSTLKAKSINNTIHFEQLNAKARVWVSEHLMYQPSDSGLVIEAQNDKWLSKTPISQMLPAANGNRNKLVPALLTSLGITGTFLGITMGLSEFNMAGDSKALIASAGELLEGMKTAFYTSLVGLSASALFMVLMKICASRLGKYQESFLKGIADHYFEASPILYLKELGGEQQQRAIEAQIRSSESIASVGTKMQQAIEGLQSFSDSFNGDDIASKVSSAVADSIDTSLAPVMSEVKQELSKLSEIKEQSQQELVELMINKMRGELIEPVTEELAKTSAAVVKSNDVGEQLNSNVERVITATSGTVDTINQFQQETMLKLQGFAESLKGILDSFRDDTQGSMSQIANEVNSMLSSAQAGLNSQRSAFEESATRATSAFEGMKDSLEGALDRRQVAESELFSNVTSRIDSLLNQVSTAFEDQTQVIVQTGEQASQLLQQTQQDFTNAVQERRKEESGLFEQMEQRISQLVTQSQDVFGEQAKTIEGVGREASALMSSAKAELEQGLGDIDNKVLNMSNTVQRELEAFREQYQQNLTAYFEQQNNLLDGSLNKQREGLNAVVENFRQVFNEEYQARHNLLQELTAQYQKLEQSAQTVERVAKAIGLNEAAKMAELQDAATSLGREVGQLKKEYGIAAKAFTDITAKMPEAMHDYFTRANESFESFFTNFDREASSIHNKLSMAAGYLINAEFNRRMLEQDEAEA
ncbi:hypothetical protein K0504_04580 [Neiella marina]|uniref:MotA/TolQ/ExbB proton channel domain-containing protein n=1 Tax=Neiella holothuriorum TaxID=2870530 RepID=A0ABS7EDG4_9GAMM|nr:hypothetical protein [Neiella holothuriorum]MBW8190305.1 hypothetical protein [Neiella holothuriorum]